MTAPPNCLQYNIGVQGSIRSFNYEDPNVSAQGYLNNLDYTICFRKEPGFCTVTYSVPTVIYNQNDPNLPQDAPVQTSPGRYFNVIPDTSTNNAVGNDQAGAGPYDCPFDYLFIAGRRLCGSRLNGQLYPPMPNPSVNGEVTGRVFHNCIEIIYKSVYALQTTAPDLLLRDLLLIIRRSAEDFISTIE